ncbi:MAG: hypothetical protein K2Q33_01355 [Gammaproteobacteria bacterium]|nr:hypothetical protein [Gammaproteobacteria bacterium]
MSIFNNSVGKIIPSLDKFDEMIDGIEKTHALADMGSTVEISGIDEAVIFRYFVTMAEMLEQVKKLASELREDMSSRIERSEAETAAKAYSK